MSKKKLFKRYFKPHATTAVNEAFARNTFHFVRSNGFHVFFVIFPQTPHTTCVMVENKNLVKTLNRLVEACFSLWHCALISSWKFYTNYKHSY